VQGLLQQFVQRGIVLPGNAHRTLRYLHEISDFPSCCIGRIEESRLHIGAARRIHQMLVPIRGYVYGSISDCEDLGRALEAAVDAFASNALVSEARVIAFRTDEGLFEPYGQADLTVEITYEI
jgi:hypothetical protein